MLIDKINVAEWFRAKSPTLARCKEGDLPLLNFSNLTCMYPGNTSKFHVNKLLVTLNIKK